ncbi:MAG: hypothetical protein AB1726_12415 [Planctomycetota bacterium]
MACSADWTVASSFGSESTLLRTDDSEAYSFDPAGETNTSVRRYALSLDEQELWGLEASARKLHRYTLPE